MKLLTSLFPSKSEKNRECIFCGKKDLTKEHIFPKWSFELFDYDNVQFQPNTIATTMLVDAMGAKINEYTERVGEPRGTRLKDFTIKIVCEDCNCGWMSSVEEEVKQVILEMKNGKELASLTVEQSLYVSRWAIYKALLLAKTTEFPINFEKSMVNQLMYGIIPEGFMVDAEILPNEYINFHISQMEAFDPQVTANLEMYSAMDNSLLCGIQLGNLALRVSYLKTSVTVYRCQIVQKSILLYPYHGTPLWAGSHKSIDLSNLSATEQIGLHTRRLTLVDNVNFVPGDKIFEEVRI